MKMPHDRNRYRLAKATARRRLMQQLADGTWQNGHKQHSGHAKKDELHEGKSTAHYNRFGA
jgi:hypothetical protein